MALTKHEIRVTPMFSLEGIPEECISKEVLKFKEPISQLLQKGEGSLKRATISLDVVPGEHRMVSGTHQEEWQTFSVRLERKGFVSAPLPYLIGMLRSPQGIFLRMSDFTFIEVFDSQAGFSVEGDAIRHLCIRKTKTGLMLDISRYVGDGKINFLTGFSSRVVRGIFFQAQPEKKSPIFSEHNLSSLSGKMIG